MAALAGRRNPLIWVGRNADAIFAVDQNGTKYNTPSAVDLVYRFLLGFRFLPRVPFKLK